MENNECVYNGNTFSHGSTVCSNGSELVCNNGNWEPTGKSCNAESSESMQNKEKGIEEK